MLISWPWHLPNVFEALVQALGILAAAHAVMSNRSSQGTIAWAIFCLTFPILGAPLYLILGRSKLSGYIEARRRGDRAIHHLGATLRENLHACLLDPDTRFPEWRVLSDLGGLPFTSGNRLTLYREGKEGFAAMFAAIDEAKEYLLIQFYIWRADALGLQLESHLHAALQRGVRVYVLYDEVGSYFLSKAYRRRLEKAGAEVAGFGPVSILRNPLRLNFRNHRKSLVVDGQIAFTGGLNVGDEYVHRSRKFGFWRDTHQRLEGPAALCVQLAFVEDWHWAAGSIPNLQWQPPPPQPDGIPTLILPTGPVAEYDSCGHAFVHLISQAQRRIWIETPYFVPDEPVLAALQLAALRGVDVRLVVPSRPDKILVFLSTYYFIEALLPARVRIYRYQPGFLHSKVLLVDDRVVALGSANIDNRSMRINFELMLLVPHPASVEAVASLVEADMAQSRQVPEDEYRRRPLWFRVAVRTARLLAPIQ